MISIFFKFHVLHKCYLCPTYANHFALDVEKGCAPFFAERALMVRTVPLTKAWREKHARYWYDFSQPEDVKKYVPFWQEAAQVPNLSDSSFYSEIIKRNQTLFGSYNHSKNTSNPFEVIGQVFSVKMRVGHVLIMVR